MLRRAEDRLTSTPRAPNRTHSPRTRRAENSPDYVTGTGAHGRGDHRPRALMLTMLGGEDTGEAVDARPDAQRLGRVP
jgi:hypothetical protein